VARFLGYIAFMFEVLVFVYENYVSRETCPTPAHLERKLNAVGFESEEIDDALKWLNALNAAVPQAPAEPWLRQSTASSMRIFQGHEQTRLGSAGIGFIRFLENCGVLSAHMREVVIDRAMAAPGILLSLDDLKIIILLVYWSFGQAPDALILDELNEHYTERTLH
jgi:Smg protein